MDPSADDWEHLLAHYALGLERDRLNQPLGAVEFERTKQEIARVLPSPPARVADVGGGPGRYAEWLVEVGYDVVHRDLVSEHVNEVRELAERGLRIDTTVEDARALSIPDASVDAALARGHVSIRSSLIPGSFSAYCHRPQQLRREITDAGFHVAEVIGLEGIAYALPDLAERMESPDDREVVISSAQRLGRIPELLGASLHLLAIAERPGGVNTPG
jgi:SAM-dependent methyltransferase